MTVGGCGDVEQFLYAQFHQLVLCSCWRWRLIKTEIGLLMRQFESLREVVTLTLEWVQLMVDWWCYISTGRVVCLDNNNRRFSCPVIIMLLWLCRTGFGLERLWHFSLVILAVSRSETESQRDRERQRERAVLTYWLNPIAMIWGTYIVRNLSIVQRRNVIDKKLALSSKGL